LVTSAANTLHDGAGAQAVLDVIEENLSSLAAIYAAPPSNAPSKPNTPRGAAKPNTVSNSLAQQRSAVVDPEDLADLPYEERVRRLLLG
jgi:hypothetical protein